VVLLAGGLLAIPYHFHGEPAPTVLFYGFMDLCLPLAVLAGAVHVRRAELARDEVRAVTRWAVVVATCCWLLYLWSRLADVLAGAGMASVRADLALYGNFGAVLGLVVGLTRARAAQNARLLDRTADQQDTLEFINHLLRHNLLNGLQVVDGYNDLLEDHVDEEGRRYVRTVRERTDHMTDLIGSVRVLMRTMAEETERFPVDCVAVVEDEVGVVRAAHPGATFETDLPDRLLVRANATLGAVLENLLTNAVVHHDGDRPAVRVSASRRSDHVVLRVADDGPGIPDALKTRYLGQGEQDPRSAGDGLGLYLAATLVEAYGGSLVIADNDPRGTVVELRLPAARSGGSATRSPADAGPPPGVEGDPLT
jgi:signal transduction histidine kinase